MNFSEERKFELMRLSIEQAKRTKLAELATQFDSSKIIPLVGGVLVSANGEVLTSAYRGETSHDRHCEQDLLEKAKGVQKADTSLFVTLEPCIYRREVVPCSKLIVESGIKKVFIGMLDPNVLINGMGKAYMEENGVVVHNYFEQFEKEIMAMNAGFIKKLQARDAEDTK